MRKIDNIGIYGPVNGIGERDLRGSYHLVSLTFEDDEIVRGRYTVAQIEELRDICSRILGNTQGDALRWPIQAEGVGLIISENADPKPENIPYLAVKIAEAIQTGNY